MLPNDFQFDKTKCAELLRDEGTFAFPIMLILSAAYDDLFEVDPLELYLRVEEDFNAELPLEAENRIQAAILAMTTDMFYTDPLTTRSVALAFYEGDLGDLVTGALEEVYLPEIVWAAYELDLMREDDEEFTPNVQLFIDELAKDAADELDIETGEVLPYYARDLMENKILLKKQLQTIGVSSGPLP